MSFSKRLLSGAAPVFAPGENFKAVLYTGNDSTQSITGVGFKPDMVWVKPRNQVENHSLHDSSRGSTNQVAPNATATAREQGSTITSFDADGFTTGSDNNTNKSGINYVAWCWKAGGGTTSSNTDGSITTTVQTNTAAGFSIMKYTGNGTVGATIGHNLGAVPNMFAVRKLAGGTNWRIYHTHTHDSNPEQYNLEFNGDGAKDDRTEWNDTMPTSSVISLNAHESVNENGSDYICYAYTDIAGYSKFGGYTGNGSASGPLVQTGFEPAFLMVKGSSNSGSWIIFDNARATTNPRQAALRVDSTAAETTSSSIQVDFLSNGFQLTGNDSDYNGSGREYIYMAFAANPDEEAPTLASSFNIETWTGNDNNNRAITGLGFSPNFVWIKRRSSSEDHALYDSIRGTNEQLSSNTTAVEVTNSSTYNGLPSFDSDGFSVGNNGGTNRAPETYVGWTWKANDDEPAVNTNGSLTSIVSANDNAGFSIVSYTGDGNSARTVGHGLSAKCDLVIIKGRDSADKWVVQFPQLGDNARMVLEGTAAKTDDSTTAQAGNATVFGIGGDNAVNKDGDKFIAYCFRNVTGYQKIGTFTGDGNNDKTITTGFKPDFVLIKSTVGNDNWRLYDTKRGITGGGYLEPNRGDADDTSNAPNLTMTATGFTITSGGVSVGNNVNGNLYTYWAIAKNVPSNTTLANSFNIELYRGTAAARSINSVGFSPDLVWLKSRSEDNKWVIGDTIRGTNKQLFFDTTDQQSTSTDRFTSFDTDGFSLNAGGSYNRTNASNVDYAAYTFKAGNNWESNVDGSINTLINANTGNGFSIVKLNKTTNSSTASTFGHGLSAAPNMILLKRTGGIEDWYVYHTSMGNAARMQLDSPSAITTGTNVWGQTNPTSSVFTVESFNAGEAIAYCFHDVAGYQKFGGYTGTGSAGQSITTGFKPDFVMIKSTYGTSNWTVYDTRRGIIAGMLNPDNDDAETTDSSADITITATGFTITSGGVSQGLNSDTRAYIYWAIAKNVASNTTLANSFKVVTYTGSNSSQDITIGFKPDLVWAKARNVGHHWGAADSITGTGKTLMLNESNTQSSGSEGIEEFGDTTIKLFGGASQFNTSGSNYVAYAWKAGNTWQSNIDGTIPSTTNTNTANGFSVVKYTGTGANTTVGHSLGAEPEVMIIKDLDNSRDWGVYHKYNTGGSGNANEERLKLNLDVTTTTYAPYWNGTTPTSTVFSLGNEGNVNTSGQDYIAYCWAPKSGFSKFGTYSGSGSAVSIDTGFQADFVMIKRTDSAGYWNIFDSVRGGDKRLYPNASNTETDESSDYVTFDSDGFNVDITSNSDLNTSGGTYIYMAFKTN